MSGILTGGAIVARCLESEGVSHLFTLCGGHIQDIYNGCITEGIRVVDLRHEQAAAMCAEGWARATGSPGVAAVTAGPGVTNAVTAVANAKRAGSPMILLGGQGPKLYEHKGALQEMNHVELLAPVTKWSAQIPSTERIPEYLAMAFRRAVTGVPGPVFLEIPLDVLMLNPVQESALKFPTRSRTEYVVAADPAGVEGAVERILAAERPAALVGSQLWYSPHRDQLDPWQRRFGLPVYLNGMARGALAPDHPGFHYHSRSRALKDCDLLVVFGTPLDFRVGYGEKIHAEAELIQVDLDPDVPGHNRGCEVGLVGDSGLVMRQMLEAAGAGEAPARSAWFAALGEVEEARKERFLQAASNPARPVDPLRFAVEVARCVTPDTTVIGDGGDIVGTTVKTLPISSMGQWMDPGPLGTLGVGPSYAIAAKLAHPDRRVLIVFGDGSFGLNGMEFEAMVRQDIPVVGVVGNDAAWRQIRRDQVRFYGAERAVATELAHTRYEAMVQAFGGHGEWVEDPAEIAPAIERGFASGKPALINVKLGVSDFRAGAISV
jgi:acetolactate synthase-1/2/3 large subunit